MTAATIRSLSGSSRFFEEQLGEKKPIIIIQRACINYAGVYLTLPSFWLPPHLCIRNIVQLLLFFILIINGRFHWYRRHFHNHLWCGSIIVTQEWRKWVVRPWEQLVVHHCMNCPPPHSSVWIFDDYNALFFFSSSYVFFLLLSNRTIC